LFVIPGKTKNLEGCTNPSTLKISPAAEMLGLMGLDFIEKISRFWMLWF
jgi:hypothetical protein